MDVLRGEGFRWWAQSHRAQPCSGWREKGPYFPLQVWKLLSFFWCSKCTLSIEQMACLDLCVCVCVCVWFVFCFKSAQGSAIRSKKVSLWWGWGAGRTMVCKILVPWSGIELRPPQRKYQVLTTGQPGNLPQVIQCDQSLPQYNLLSLPSLLIPGEKVAMGDKTPELFETSNLIQENFQTKRWTCYFSGSWCVNPGS